MLTERQIELVENSWDFIILNTQEAGMLFYNRLFEIAPELKHLFKEDIKSQSHKLVALISFAIHKLRNIESIVSDVQALGIRHKNYHVTPEHYNKVGEALLWTLEQGLKDEWNDEMREAWVSVYTLLSDVMIDAAEKSRATVA